MSWENSIRISTLFAVALCAACGSDAGSDGGSSGSSGMLAGGGSNSSAAAGAGVGPTAGTHSGGAQSSLPGSAGTATGGGTSTAGASSAAGAGGIAGSSASSGAGGNSNGGSVGTAGGAGVTNTGGAGNCPAADALKTNNAKQDAYDCAILQVAQKWGMPDPMIVKAQIQQESSFQIFATSGDSPCGTMQGWSDAESKSFGLIQTTPACGEALTARLANGHPNLTKDMTAALWANSVFNPTINLDEGVKTDVDNLKELKKKYAGCSDIQYNMMAAGAFNSGTGAITGCAGYNARAQMYVTAITGHYHQFAKAAAWPDPY